MLAPERRRVLGDDLRHRTHPDGRARGKVGELIRQPWFEADARDREGGWDGDDGTAGARRAVAVVDLDAVVDDPHCSHRGVEAQRRAKALAQCEREGLGSVLKAHGGRVDRVAGNALHRAARLEQRIACDVLGMRANVEVAHERLHAGLVGPEPRRAEIDRRVPIRIRHR